MMRCSVSKRSKLGAFKSFSQQIRALDRRRSSSLYITKLGIHAAGSSKPACLGALPVCNFTRQHVTASAYAPDARTPCGRGRKKKSTQSHSLMRHGHAGSKSTLMCWSIYMSLLGKLFAWSPKAAPKQAVTERPMAMTTCTATQAFA